MKTNPMKSIDAHNREIHDNLENWKRKPVLREIYRGFHRVIAGHLPDRAQGLVVELGSGVADIREVIPGCIRTDLFPNPWIDRVENAYSLSFGDASLSALILFDVFHHLRYPGTALKEFRRVLAPQGRVLIFEPCLSVLGWLVYGLLHQEPVGARRGIQWEAPAGWSPADIDYYAAQGNATRVFLQGEIDVRSSGWEVVAMERLCSLSYVASGGYSRPQLYPDKALPLLLGVDRVLGALPGLFATRLLAVLEKRGQAGPSARGDS